MVARVCKILAAAEEAPQVLVPQMKREIVEVIQPALVKRIKGRVAEKDGGYPGASRHGGNHGSCVQEEEEEELVPQ